jgi:hypothetical protein
VNLDELRAFAEHHTTRSAFRLETLDRYTVDSDEGNVERYLAGEEGPSWAQGSDWMDYLQQEKASGIRRYRVHIAESPLSDYLRYECEWGYVYTSQAGEEIYILDTAENPRPPGLIDEDFWLYDDTHVVVMHYDGDGRFITAEALPDSETPRYRRYRDLALSAAVPFADYWQRHPGYWRENQHKRH